MSSYFAGGGRAAAYKLESLNLDCIKSPPSSSWTSSSSSPSSTLSESTNSQLTIAPRKARTPRKRPNQAYDEAAAILSTACPEIFHLAKPRTKLRRSQQEDKSFEAIDGSGFLIDPTHSERAHFRKGFEKPCLSPGEIDSQVGRRSPEIEDRQQLLQHQEDFDAAESMLDEEMGEGIDSIMGIIELNDDRKTYGNAMQEGNFVYGYPVGLGFDYDYVPTREFRAIRSVGEGDWWRSPFVKMADLNPKKKKKKEVNKKSIAELLAKECFLKELAKDLKNEKSSACKEEDAPQLPKGGLILKLNYDDVLRTWADKGSPFSGGEFAGDDVQTRLSGVDLFPENGGMREACVLRYKEKRRTRLFSKKIRYHVRKVNADRRPRMKGRFVRTPNSSEA